MDTLHNTQRKMTRWMGGLFLASLVLVWWHSRVETYALTPRPDSRQAYLAAGKHGVILLQLPAVQGKAEFKEIARFDTSGKAMDLDARSDVLYVADGTGGLRILQAENDTLRESSALPPPVWAGKNPADTLALSDDGKHVFVGYGVAGVEIVDVSDAGHPKEVQHISLPSGQVVDLTVEDQRLFVAAGKGSLLVYDVSEIQRPQRILQDAAQLGMPTEVVGVDAIGSGTVVLAAANHGVEIFTIEPPSPPVSIAEAPDIGPAQGVTVIAPAGEQGIDRYWIFAAVQGKGLQILEFNAGEEASLEPKGSLLSLGGDVRMTTSALGDAFAYAVSGKGRIFAVDVTSPEEPRVAARYSVVTRRSAVILWAAAAAVWLALTLLWMGFFAQFVLPVRTFGERVKVWLYLLIYSFGGHGPAIFVEDGIRRESRAESLRGGPAVMLLDTASAAVLKTPGAFTRAVGPGVVFLKGNERSAGEVDLHRQTQFIGPKGEGDVFAPQRPDESDDEYQARLEARDETIGQTRDGIPVAPNIIAVFKLYTEPEDMTRWPTRFGYRPDSVWKAIVGEGINLDVRAEELPEKRRMAWNWLPAYLAVDVWREYVRKFTLEELFQAKYPSLEDPARLLTGMEVITQEVARRFRDPKVPALDGFGRYEYQANGTPLMVPSREFEIIRSRGLRVYTIVITNLRLPMAIEEQLLADWQSSWEFQVSNLGSAAERIRIREADKVRMNALVEYALWSSRALYRRLQDTGKPQPDEPETLEIMLEDLRQHIAEELNLRRRMTTEWEDWQDLLDWIRM